MKVIIQLSQRARELAWASSVLELDQPGHGYKIENADPPNPDIVVTSSSGDRFGMEITEVYQVAGRMESSPQALESLDRKLAELVSREWDSRQLPPVDGTIGVEFTSVRLARPLPAIASDLCDAVAKVLPLDGHNVILSLVDENHGLPSPVQIVGVTRLDSMGESNWQASQGGVLHRLQPASLQVSLNEKNAKYPQYVVDVPACWLLIVANGFNKSSTFDIDRLGTCTEQTYRSAFDRTILYEPFGKIIWELETI